MASLSSRSRAHARVKLTRGRLLAPPPFALRPATHAPRRLSSRMENTLKNAKLLKHRLVGHEKRYM